MKGIKAFWELKNRRWWLLWNSLQVYGVQCEKNGWMIPRWRDFEMGYGRL